MMDSTVSHDKICVLVGLARDNIPIKNNKNRRPRRNNRYKTSLLLIYSVVAVTLTKRRVYELYYLVGWLLKGEGVRCALSGC